MPVGTITSRLIRANVALKRSFERGLHEGECRIQLRPKTLRDNDRNGNAGGNQAVFNRCGRGLLANKVDQGQLHNGSPSLRPVRLLANNSGFPSELPYLPRPRSRAKGAAHALTPPRFLMNVLRGAPFLNLATYRKGMLHLLITLLSIFSRSHVARITTVYGSTFVSTGSPAYWKARRTSLLVWRRTL
jgi:hypothetical protein